MASERQRILHLAEQVRPLAARTYAESRGWCSVEGAVGRIWLLRHPVERLRQLQIPMDAEGEGFGEAMLDVALRLAEIERRPVDEVLVDLQWPDADVVRVRVASPSTEGGQVPLLGDLSLRDGIRRALLASACSVLNPVAFHPRLSRSEADALLAACQAGQTERGSYVVKVVCPLFAVEDEAGPAGGVPFARRVTSLLMRGVAALVESVEQDRVEDYVAATDAQPIVSWNLCDALLRMQPERGAGLVELSTAWAADRRVTPPRADEVPARVAIRAEYMPSIERAAALLRPNSSEPREELLIGTVETLSGSVGRDGRRAGEVHFSLLLPDSETLRARATLEPEHYAVAMRAHEHGRAYVRIHGVLRRGGRGGRIDPVRDVRLLEDE